MCEEVSLEIYQIVVQSFFYSIEDDSGAIIEKGKGRRFNLDTLDFENENELEDYLNGTSEHNFDRSTEDEIQFLNDKKKHEPDEGFNQYNNDWDEFDTFKNYDDAIAFRQKLINSFESSDNKNDWDGSEVSP